MLSLRMSYSIGDIIYFESYTFTDIRESNSRPHFALVLIPTDKSQAKNVVYCAVITSNEPKEGYYLKCELEKYKCFTKECYVAFLRQDMESLTDLSKKKEQPVGALNAEDLKRSFQLLKIVLYNPSLRTSRMNEYLKSVIIREWEKKIASIK